MLKISVFAIILSFYASFLVVKIQLPSMDNDAGLYITDGKVIWQTHNVFKHNYYSYVETDYPFINDRWLSSVIFYLVSAVAGFGGLTIFKTAILFSAFAILFFAAIKKADFWLVAAASLPAILILSGRNRIRPEMFSYLFISLFFYLLFDFEKHPERKRIFWLIPLQLLWVNFHLFFFLGIALVGGFLFEKIIFNFRNLKENLLIKKLIFILAGLIIVCFINPNGVRGALAPFISHSYPSFMVSENLPFFNFKASFFSWNLTSSPFVPMAAIFLLSLIFGLGQKNIFLALAGIASAVIALTSVRLTALFAIIFLIAAPINFNVIFLKIKNYFKEKRPKFFKFFCCLLAIIIVAAFPYTVLSQDKGSVERGYLSDRGIGLDRYSNGAGNFWKEQNLEGPIFDDYDIGGYILYNVFPKEKVFIDNNGADTYSVSFFSDIYVPTLSDEGKWHLISEKYKINAIFISQRDGSPMVGSFLWNRLHDPLWALVYADTYAVILLKNTPENKDVIKKFQITKENVTEKIGSMIASDPLDKMVGSRLLYLIGREDLAVSTLKKIAAKYPKNSWVWYYMGVLKVMKDDLSSAISATIFLENALNMGEKTADCYTYLGLAYIETSQFIKAQEVFKKALWLEPGRYDATNYLAQLKKAGKQ